MSLTIFTTSFKRPKTLKKLANLIIPILDDFNGTLKWMIIIDEIKNEQYEIILNEIKKKLKNKNLITWSYQVNIGKFRSLVKFLKLNLDTEWLVNIDDDDLIINFKFKKFVKNLNNYDESINAILTPRLILNLKFDFFTINKKKKIFLKYNNKKMNYFEFKEKFGDYDSLIFFRNKNFNHLNYPETEKEKFTAESLLWLDLFRNKEVLIKNNFLLYSEYLTDGLSKLSIKKRTSNPISSAAVYKKFLDFEKFRISKIHIKSLINYYRFKFHAKIKINLMRDKYSNFFIRFFSAFFAKLIFYLDLLILKRIDILGK